ncbi:MAG: SDR family NAD(P)-dependent oxidoreductase [Rhodobacteraceae bacterium]|nr:SDR family NAD(P)-dependent oxidoreductase [Paracoccaceae bacterium]
MTDLTGKTALVTGANTGLGFETAKGLAQMGARVILAGRDPEKVDGAIARLTAGQPDAVLEPGIVDLNSPASVARFAGGILGRRKRLDLLVNNAGVMVPPAGTTADGYETQFGVNFLAHFALTGHLFSLLASTFSARVVTLSSIGHRGATVDFDNFRLEKPYDPWREYGQSKLADLIFALEFDTRLRAAGAGIASLAAHPGVSATELTRNLGVTPDNVQFMTAADGAASTLMAATSQDAKSGQYFGPDGPGETSGQPALARIDPAARDAGVRSLLWDWAEAATGLRFP